jgi:pimeloyl-ACP methyl ester carboxylesterase
LIVQGDRDIFYPMQISVDMYRDIPNSSLWIVPNAGHVPITEENMSYFIKTAKKHFQML